MQIRQWFLLVAAVLMTPVAATVQQENLYAQVKNISQNSNEEWFGFAAYPGARELCSQSVLGEKGEEILWHSYAVKDSTSRVTAFYVKEHNEDKGGQSEIQQTGNTLTLRRGDIVLTVQAASGSYPQCERKPRALEKTVIVVSQMIDRRQK